MRNPVKVQNSRASNPLALSYGRITGRVENRFRVDIDAELSTWALKADGCLLEPDKGDLVLIVEGGGSEAFILNVLVKDGVESTIDLPGQAKISGDSISLAARSFVSLEAPGVDLAGVTGTASFVDMRLRAESCRLQARKASLVVRFFDSVMDRITQRVKNSFRTVEDTDTTTAGRIRTKVRQRFSLKAKHASVLTEEEVCVDGKQIRIG